jgi:hypothetical protein
MQKKWIKSWGEISLGHVMDDREVPEIVVKLCLMKSVVKLAMFVKKLWETGC